MIEGETMPTGMVKTQYPGVYRRGERYAFTWRDRQGKQRWGNAPTERGAYKQKALEETKVMRGEGSSGARDTLHAYARAWVDRYQGHGRRGFREETRAEYRGLLEKYALRYFPKTVRVAKLEPIDVAEFIGWLIQQPNGRGGTLSDKSVRNAVSPLRACLATARVEGMIRWNPAEGVQLPHRPRLVDEDGEDVRALTREQLRMVLELAHPRHRLIMEFTAATGLRASEVIGLQRRHLQLDGDRPRVEVRQRVRGGRAGALKSKYARRDVPLSLEMVDQLRAHLAANVGRAQKAIVFESRAGTWLHKDTVRNRWIRPAAEEAGVPWVGWHTFRHTCASILFERGANAVQVQRWLGHHDPAFTLKTYVHLLTDTIDEPLSCEDLLGVNANANGTTPKPAERYRDAVC